MRCTACGSENEPGRKFCGECGAPLALACASCGAPNPPTVKFCGECGSPLAGQEPAARPAVTPLRAEAPAAERRLVSVLFADLVGFTTLSERRDPEDVRELLTRYFDTCRRLITRYGGTVEKFIGDAVMAVWGTPVAQEDDAERAVRAALELTQAVTALGADVDAPELRARAGVLTGEAAVTIGAEGQGMVAGDLVNTASRIQSAAEPGAVFVGVATRRATESSIVYEDAGSHELKGKAEPVPLWRAVRVVAGVRGALRATGLEAPFVGRDREMRLVKELFHDAAEERKAHLVSVTGIGGIGKSRLAWEFEKYADGLAEINLWHRGRCVAYGEGVTYWALAEMVRMRTGIVEGEETGPALGKLRATIDEYLTDPEERRWVEPRLSDLLGLEERVTRDPADLFAAWRLFFERMAEQYPTVMVFEDLQWADAALLDFIEYLLEWSREFPLFVMTLARPELADRRPNWGAGKRNSTSLFLEPLSPEAMDELLRGLVPGLSDELRGKVLERAEGVPMYAVETIRMLIDRGLLVQEGNQYRPAGPIEALDVPETLHALIAARLDGISLEERRLLQDGAVLGKTFTKQSLAGLNGIAELELEGVLSSLVRKEFLSIQADPRSPERGQYGFLQDLVRHVAYETLSMKERKIRHLAAARSLEATRGAEAEEIVEVLASHYLEAYHAAENAPDAPAIKAKAGLALVGAGERAASLGATEEAQRYFEQAAGLEDEPLAMAGLYERAGQMASRGARFDEATGHLERAIELFESNGQTHPAARVSARLGNVTWALGHIDQAVERMERSFAILSEDEPDEDLATLAAQLGRLQFFMGQTDRAAERIERALDIAEALWLPEDLSQALNTKGLILTTAKRRPQEGVALLRQALKIALDYDRPTAALRAYFNLSNLLYYQDQNDAAIEYALEGLTLARRLGERDWEWSQLAELVSVRFLTGEWDEALQLATEIPHLEDFAATRFASLELLLTLPQIHLARGDLDRAVEVMAHFEPLSDSADVQESTTYAAARSCVFRGEGNHTEALAWARRALERREALGATFPGFKLAIVEAAEAAFALGELDTVQDLVRLIERLSAGEASPYLRAQADRFSARLAELRGDPKAVEPSLKSAAGLFREIGSPFPMAVALLELGEWLKGTGRGDEAESLLSEAEEIFARLKAQPWLDRLSRAGERVPAASS